ncbi:unnamed protein product [Meloidogyne enterolobii]|uniref:Uncharacterized protein n=1 Tax=Meloidogyne enterolobii TaxID=390850 RepID=A0ACB0YGM3_MELEN
MECSMRIRVIGETKQCPQCRTDISILYYVSAPPGQKLLLKLPTNCIDHTEYEAKFSVRFDLKYALECFDSFLVERRKKCVERLNEWVFFDTTKNSKTSIIHGRFEYILESKGIWRCSKNPDELYKCNAYLKEFQKNYILCADHTCDLIKRWGCVDKNVKPNLGMENCMIFFLFLKKIFAVLMPLPSVHFVLNMKGLKSRKIGIYFTSSKPETR